MLYLEKFYNNIKSLVKALKGNRRILASCGESKSSILENLLKVLEKPQMSKFNIYLAHFQEKYDIGTNIYLDYFMRDIVMKYDSLVKYGQLDKKLRKRC